MPHAMTNMDGTENKIRVDYQKISEISPEQVWDYLGTTRSGLKEETAQQRLLVHGDNSIKSKQSFHPLRRFVKQLINILAIMLWVASAMALISGTPVLAYVIWFIILVNAFFSFFQESKADHALQALSKMIPNNVKAYRDGTLTVMSADKLVPGDVIELTAGDRVPADVRLIEGEGVFVDNSMLTGESVPVDREPDADPLSGKSLVNSRNLLFAGTSITEGKGTGVVYGTGKQTQIGNITQTTAHIVRRKSTLDAQIQKITRTLSVIAVTLGVLAFLASTLITGFSVNSALIFAIGIIVANIPEGLMPTVSLSLALGVQRMAKKNALVRRQSAVETLSSTSVICTDKTGTLTQNAIFAREVWTPDGSIEIGGNGYEKQGKVSGITESNRPGLDRLFTASAICSDTVLQTKKEDQTQWKMIGSPTEAAILVASYKYGKPADQVKAQFTRQKVRPFSSNTKSMTVLAVNNQSSLFEKDHVIQFTKGDPTRVLARCGYLYRQGKIVEVTDTDRAQVRTVNDQMAGKGFRVLAIACADRTAHPESEAEDLVLLGLVIMYDPPKKGVREAIRDCYKAGIKVTIVTGDYALTAAAIARQIGIVKDKYVAITGAELEKMSRQELAKRINTDLPVIFARTTPKDKLKIVETYQNLGHVVASTGDGINDVLALRKADIGIAMGENGSDAAIESSDVVLLDDNFATIVEAVKEGRAIYENIRKFITYILASNVPEVLPFIAMAVFHIPLALTVLLVLSIDLGTDLVPAISLGEELPDKDVLDYPPRKSGESILNGRVLLRSYCFLGIVESAMLFLLFFLSWESYGVTPAETRQFTETVVNGTAGAHVQYIYQYAITMGFGAVIFCQIGNLLECRSPRLSLFTMLNKRNHLMVWGILIEIVLFLLIAYVPILQFVFGTATPQFNHLFLLLICPVVIIAAEEVRKWFVKKRNQVHRHEIAFH
jgi:ATPase, P-type (transporting), HAD superfamily, subfamily IC